MSCSCVVKTATGAHSQSAEKMMHVLSAYTRDGTVFSLDARLRPRGGEGRTALQSDAVDGVFRSTKPSPGKLDVHQDAISGGLTTLGERRHGSAEDGYLRGFAAVPASRMRYVK